MENRQIRPRLKGNKLVAYNNLTKRESRILVIGDLHCPFELEEYFDFCVDTYRKYNCNKVIFIGDLVDNHYSSYHETFADGLGGGDELDEAVEHLEKWFQMFPVADIIIGNHDRMIMRKAQTSDIPSKWIKSYNEVLNTPSWKWVERVVYDNVQYVHGEGGTARTKARNDFFSTVQGHIHTQAYVEWMIGRKRKILSMQVGCGIDTTSYAQAYAKHFKKQAIGCGVVIGGHTAINVMMDL